MPHHLQKSIALATLALVAITTISCDDDDKKKLPGITADALAHYAAIVHATYTDTHTTAQAMHTALAALAATPTTDTLAAARQSWLTAREPYLQTEVYRFYEGPIDHPETGPEGLLNAWPLDESYIDSIITDPARPLTADALAALNEQGGEQNIATGYHAIEYLLWGADHSPDGPGARPATDFDGATPELERRRRYLTTASTMLIGHLADLVTAWAPDADNYRRDFLAAPPEVALGRVLTGMILLAGFETGGERLQAALTSGDQEDEHSCFSDNTHRDMIQDVRGIRNVWLGEYTRVTGGTLQGPGIEAIVRAKDPALAGRITAAIEKCLADALALDVPFDRSIVADNTAGRAKVTALITSLRALEDQLEATFALFGLQVPSPE